MGNEFVEELTLSAKDEASSVVRGIMSNLRGLLGQITALAGVSFGFGAFVKEGIEFNSMMEDTRSGIAAVLLANQQFRKSNGDLASSQEALNEAQRQASEVQEKLRVDALQTAATYQELVQGFQAAVGPALTVGVTKVDDVRKITVAAAQAMAALKIPTVQTAQELRALFTGETGPDNRLNQTLRITKAEIEAVKARGGDLAEFYLKKLAPFSAAAADATANFSVRLSNLKDVLGQVAGEATKPIFEILKKGITGAGDAIQGASGYFNGIGIKVAEILQKLSPLIESIVKLGAVALEAGVDFVNALGPIVPLLTGIVDAVTLVVGSLGPLAPAVYLGVKAFSALAGSQALVSGLASLISGALAGSIAANLALLGLWAAAFAAVGAAIYAVKLYLVDLKREQEAADHAWDGARKGVEAYTLKLLESGKATQAQKNELRALLTNIGSVADGSREFDAMAKRIRDIGVDMKVTRTETGKFADAVKGVPKKLPLSPEELKKLHQHLEQIEKAMEEGRKAAIKYAEDGDKAIAKYRDTLESLGRLVERTAREQIIADADKQRRDVENRVKEVELWRLSLAEVVELYRLRDRAIAQVDAGMYERLAHLVPQVQQLWLQSLPIPRSTQQVVEKQLGEIAKSLGSWGDTVKRATTEIWGSMAQAFDEGFYLLLKGRFDELGGVVKNFGDSLVKTMAKALSDVAQRSILVSIGFKQNADGSYALADGKSGANGVGGLLNGLGGLLDGKGFKPGGSTNDTWGGVLSGALSGYAIGQSFASGNPYNRGRDLVMTYASTVGGAIGGPYGQIIGIAVGAALKALIGPKENHRAFGGSRGLLEQYVQPWQDAQSAFLSQTGNLFGAYDPKQRAALTQDMQRRMAKYLGEHTYDVHAGNPEDFGFDVQQLFSRLLPRDFLRLGFGRTLPANAFPGIDTIFTGRTGTEDAAREFDPDAPIAKMLLGLGFTAERVKNLAASIDTEDPQRLMGWLTNVVGLVVGFKDLQGKFGASLEDTYAEIDRRKNMTPLQSLREQADEIKFRGRQLSMYSGEEQVTRAKELLDLSIQRYEAELRYIAEIKGLAEDIGKSIAQQQEDIRLSNMLPEDKKGYYQTKVHELQAQLEAATDPARIRELVAAIQQNYGSLYSLYGEDDPQRAQVGLFIIKALDWVNQMAQDKLRQAAEEAKATSNGLDVVMKNAMELFTHMNFELTSTGDAVSGAGDDVERFGTGIRRGTIVVTSFADAVEAATRRISQANALPLFPMPVASDRAEGTPQPMPSPEVLLRTIRNNPQLAARR